MQKVGIWTIDSGRCDLTHLDSLYQTTLPPPVPPEADLRCRICLQREVAHLFTI